MFSNRKRAIKFFVWFIVLTMVLAFVVSILPVVT